MIHIEFFKLQAKNLFRDFKTKTPYFDNVIEDYLYEYNPKHFDIAWIVPDFDIDEDDFSLMKAQHIIANMVGFRKWTDLLMASGAQQELAKLLLENQDKISLEDWEMYIQGAEYDNRTTFDDELRLEIFKEVFLNVEGHQSPFKVYRLNKGKN
jgi:hypothetical protein